MNMLIWSMKIGQISRPGNLVSRMLLESNETCAKAIQISISLKNKKNCQEYFHLPYIILLGIIEDTQLYSIVYFDNSE